ncbi:ATP-grasp domain-containing protein [Dickeya chrysanthemi]|uniref:ATP-grasp domain-containing protein n=1 Tax=Dickeya chrysanthemi TaxID=556 RepID=UPI003019DF97
MKKIALIGGWDALVDLVVEQGHELYLYYFNDDDFNEVSISRCQMAIKLSHIGKLDDVISSDCKRYGFDLIYSHKEVYQEKVAKLAETLKVNGLNFQAVHAFKNKFAFRTLLEKLTNHSTPWREVNSSDDIAHFIEQVGGDIILKPYDGMGSNNIKKISCINEVDNVHDFPLLAESFVGGDEYSVEFISCNGKHYPVGITEKVTSGQPYFFEISHTFPANLSSSQEEKIYDVVCSMLDLADYKNGASHTEFKIHDQQVVLIESHTRVGGDRIPVLISESSGYDIIKENMNAMLGEPVHLPVDIHYQKNASIVYFHGCGGCLTSMSFLDEIHNKCGEKLLLLKFDYKLNDQVPETKSSSTRYGFVIITGSEKELVEQVVNVSDISHFLKK